MNAVVCPVCGTLVSRLGVVCPVCENPVEVSGATAFAQAPLSMEPATSVPSIEPTPLPAAPLPPAPHDPTADILPEQGPVATPMFSTGPDGAAAAMGAAAPGAGGGSSRPTNPGPSNGGGGSPTTTPVGSPGLSPTLATTTTRAPTTTTTRPPTTTTTAPRTWSETAGGVAHTWANYTNAGGTQGPNIAGGQTVQIACKLTGFRVADGNTWWYRIAQSPWNNQYYVSADAFYNNGATPGSLVGTPFVDPAVANC